MLFKKKIALHNIVYLTILTVWIIKRDFVIFLNLKDSVLIHFNF